MKMDKNEHYEHFNTIEECDAFVRQMTSHKYNVLGRCCGGKGACVRDAEWQLFIHKQNNPVKRMPVKLTQDDSCCVCFELCNEVTSCGHLVCMKCAPRVRPLCPYCRQTM
jgi:hypothetical protein